MKKMNMTLLLGAVAGTIMLGACGTAEAPATDNAAASTTAGAGQAAYHIDTEASSVNWTGTMLGVKSHTGTLRFSDGELGTTGGALTGGSFTVDMKSYVMTDDNYAPDGSEQGTRANLMGHLMSPDFFDVENHPTAHFAITKVDGNTAEGNLTVRGATHPETVKNIVVTQDGDNITATGDLTFDRQKYGVSWSSPMKDMVLSNDIVIKVELKGAATPAS